MFYRSRFLSFYLIYLTSVADQHQPMQKNQFFHIFYLLIMKFKSFKIVKTCSKIKNFNFQQENLCIRILFCNYSFIPLNTFTRKEKDPDPFLWLTDPGPKYTDPTDPELEHCKEKNVIFFLSTYRMFYLIKTEVKIRIQQKACFWIHNSGCKGT